VVFFVHLVRFTAVVTKVQKSPLSHSFSCVTELHLNMSQSGSTIKCDISHQYFAFVKHREETHTKQCQNDTLLEYWAKPYSFHRRN